MRAILALSGSAALAACTTAPPPPSLPSDPARVGVQRDNDTCRAAAHAHLIGQPVSAAPRPTPGRGYRLATDDGPITMDYSPQRLNIFYNERSRRIVGIRCG